MCSRCRCASSSSSSTMDRQTARAPILEDLQRALGLHAAAPGERRQGRGAAPRVRGSDRRHRRHPGCRPRVLAGRISRSSSISFAGTRRRRVRLAFPRTPSRVPLHALPRQPARDARDQRAVQHDADRHGDVLQGDARRTCSGRSRCDRTTSGSSRKSRRRSSSAATACTKMPITYAGRGYDEGKKITWTAGLVALWVLLKYRFTD